MFCYRILPLDLTKLKLFKNSYLRNSLLRQIDVFICLVLIEKHLSETPELVSLPESVDKPFSFVYAKTSKKSLVISTVSYQSYLFSY